MTEHDLHDPVNHEGHQVAVRYSYCWECRKYVAEQLIVRDGHCSVCGAHVVEDDR